MIRTLHDLYLTAVREGSVPAGERGVAVARFVETFRLPPRHGCPLVAVGYDESLDRHTAAGAPSGVTYTLSAETSDRQEREEGLISRHSKLLFELAAKRHLEMSPEVLALFTKYRIDAPASSAGGTTPSQRVAAMFSSSQRKVMVELARRTWPRTMTWFEHVERLKVTVSGFLEEVYPGENRILQKFVEHFVPQELEEEVISDDFDEDEWDTEPGSYVPDAS